MYDVFEDVLLLTLHMFITESVTKGNKLNYMVLLISLVLSILTMRKLKLISRVT